MSGAGLVLARVAGTVEEDDITLLARNHHPSVSGLSQLLAKLFFTISLQLITFLIQFLNSEILV